MKTAPILTEAFSYLVKGYSVIPLKKDKRPNLLSWKKYQAEKASEDQVIEWFENDKNNVGIVTGKISGITVIDIDCYKGNETMIDKFPETYTVKTGNGGYHLYYQYQEGLTISAGAYPQFPNLDIRSDGGFVVASPSVTDYLKDGKKSGGKYEVIKNIPLAKFPIELFGKTKTKRSLSTTIGVSTGGRNDSIASVIGSLLLSAKESDFEKEVYPAILQINKTYNPPLPETEVRATFDSILKKEIDRRASLIISPIQVEGADPVGIRLRKNKSGTPHKDMANVIAILSNHPYYKNNIRYNEFKHEIEYKGKPLTDSDLNKIQYFMQNDCDLSSISKEAVHSAVSHWAEENKYDEAKDWLKSLVWDETPRLKDWVHSATGVENDTYHQGIGSQWFMGMINRIMNPGSVFDYMLVLVGPQGIGKTSLFRIIGGDWYKCFTGSMDNKDFCLALRGALIVDLDEGAAMNKTEAIKIKSTITLTHDEYRAPYDRIVKKYPRRFVFSMSTNDNEPFRDLTGNRRYWTIDAKQNINFKWLEENRDQLFAEAYYYFVNKIKVAEVPLDLALEHQENHLPEDMWAEAISKEVKKDFLYCEGSEEYSTTVQEIYLKTFKEEDLSKLSRFQEMRISNIFKKDLGLCKKRAMVDGERRWRWFIDDEKLKYLKENNIKKTTDELEF